MYAYSHMYTYAPRNQWSLVFLYGSASASTMDKEESGAKRCPSPTNSKQMQAKKVYGFWLGFLSPPPSSTPRWLFFPASLFLLWRRPRRRGERDTGTWHACMSVFSPSLFPPSTRPICKQEGSFFFLGHIFSFFLPFLLPSSLLLPLVVVVVVVWEVTALLPFHICTAISLLNWPTSRTKKEGRGSWLAVFFLCYIWCQLH